MIIAHASQLTRATVARVWQCDPPPTGPALHSTKPGALTPAAAASESALPAQSTIIPRHSVCTHRYMVCARAAKPDAPSKRPPREATEGSPGVGGGGLWHAGDRIASTGQGPAMNTSGTTKMHRYTADAGACSSSCSLRVCLRLLSVPLLPGWLLSGISVPNRRTHELVPQPSRQNRHCLHTSQQETLYLGRSAPCARPPPRSTRLGRAL